jgi:hypothetical protein
LTPPVRQCRGSLRYWRNDPSDYINIATNLFSLLLVLSSSLSSQCFLRRRQGGRCGQDMGSEFDASYLNQSTLGTSPGRNAPPCAPDGHLQVRRPFRPQVRSRLVRAGAKSYRPSPRAHSSSRTNQTSGLAARATIPSWPAEWRRRHGAGMQCHRRGSRDCTGGSPRNKQT